MRESRPYGSVRGARGNSRPYRALLSVANFAAPAQVSPWHQVWMPNCPAHGRYPMSSGPQPGAHVEGLRSKMSMT